MYYKNFCNHACFLVIALGFCINPSAAQTQDSACFARSTPNHDRIQSCETELQSLKQNASTTASGSPGVIDYYLQLIRLNTHRGDFDTARRWLIDLELIPEQQFTGKQFYNYLRRKGILLYRQGELPAALKVFRNALEHAESTNNDSHIAKSLSDMGTAHMAMMEYPDALSAYKRSLSIKEQYANAEAIAVTLNNIGSVYRHMSDWQQAEVYYRQAIEHYHQSNRPGRIAHTRENLGVVYLNLGQFNRAIELFLQSFDYFKQSNNNHAQLRLSILLGKAYLNREQISQAEQYLKLAETLALETGNTDQSNALKLQLGRLASIKGSYQQAESLLIAGLNDAQNHQQRDTALAILQALIDNAVAFEQWQTAFNYQKQLTQSMLDARKVAFTDSLAHKRAAFEYEQQLKEIALLNKDKKIQALELKNQRSQLTSIVLGSLFLTLLLGWIIFWLWKKRRELAEQYHKEIAYHRQQVEKLGVNYASLKKVFGQFKQPIIIINNQQTILFANEACRKLLNMSDPKTGALALKQIVPESNREFWQLWRSQDEIDNQYVKHVCFSINGTESEHSVLVSTLHREESIGVIILCDPKQDANGLPVNALLPTASFHQQLVDLMISSLENWETATQSTRIELAEQSGIWRVSIDDGRLRTRSLDRYLSLKTLPKKPRWREVVRTAHFVLAECQLDPATKSSLEDKLAAVTDHLRAEALI